jgi:SAM-dependent methyltransferase
VNDGSRSWGAAVGYLAKRLLLAVPLPQSPRRRAADSAAYWSDTAALGEQWRADSHTRGAVPGWELIGTEHLAYFQDFVRAVQGEPRPARVLEWGAGGGANAVAFAPAAQEFIAVEVSPAALTECRERVVEVCETVFTPVLVPVDSPESAREQIDGQIDLFLCFYVMELLPSRQHARRVLETAAGLLRTGGLAVVQVKYRTRSPLTWSRTWAYRRGVASMTSFGIDEFWTLCAASGLTPHSVRLVPRNRLDSRYAYYFLIRS